MAVLSAEKVAKGLCAEWGIDSTRVVSITIELHPASVASAVIKYNLGSNEVAILKTYKLEEKENE